MLTSLKYLNRALHSYDSLLYACEHRMGRFDVYRKSQTGSNPPNFLFSLTDTWQPQGRPVSYGVEAVLNRIKAHDLWRDDSFTENWIKEHEKHIESAERARTNSIESFLYDFRRQFQRATNGINTASLNKTYRKET